MWFLSSRKTRSKTAIRPRRCSYRPRLEVLEDRTVPASLSYPTFLHGTVYATAVDGAGNVYVTGQTDSSLPTTPGAFEMTGTGAFVAKLNPTGTAVLYATYLGNGNFGRGEGTGIAVDVAGDVYVIGAQANIPTTANAIASSGGTNNPAQADFVAELNPTGSGLIYATYLPGTVNFPVTLGLSGAIALDGSGNIYVAGAAYAGFPVTAGAFQTAYLDGNPGGGEGNNAFFAKINPTLSGSASLLYATYLGGTGSLGDAASGIALDSAGNVYLEGYTGSTNFPTTTGAFQSTYGGGSEDAFVAKFNPALSGAASLVYSTFLGGSGADGYVSGSSSLDNEQTAGGIAVDSADNAYVTGSTASTNFPTTPGAFQVHSSLSTNGRFAIDPSDVFVTKLNATGSALVYSTYIDGGTFVSGKYHGKPVISGTRSGGASIAVDASGDAELTGWTNSTTFPTVNALQTTNGGGYDAVVTVLNPAGSSLLFSSYFGGSGNDLGYGIALDSAGNAYVGGQAGSSNFPITPGAYQTTQGGGFVLKIDPPADRGAVTATAVGDSNQTAMVNSRDLNAGGVPAPDLRLEAARDAFFARAEENDTLFRDPMALTSTVQ
jgi:Beta-propeller repeat